MSKAIRWAHIQEQFGSKGTGAGRANRLTSYYPIWEQALATAAVQTIAHTPLKLISPVAFLATKHVAFVDRGMQDYYGSHDLEDLIAVVDGRERIATEVDAAPTTIRSYVISSVRALLAIPAFDEALPGHLPGDRASQQRLAGLRRKLQAIGACRIHRRATANDNLLRSFLTQTEAKSID